MLSLAGARLCCMTWEYPTSILDMWMNLRVFEYAYRWATASMAKLSLYMYCECEIVGSTASYWRCVPRVMLLILARNRRFFYSSLPLCSQSSQSYALFFMWFKIFERQMFSVKYFLMAWIARRFKRLKKLTKWQNNMRLWWWWAKSL